MHLIENTLRAGALATLGTTAAVAACGKVEDDHAIAPINAVSHIVWGYRAARTTRPSWKYTLPGLVLNAAAVTMWAAIHQAMFAPNDKRRVEKALIGGAAVSGLAYLVDYHVVPERLTPGFEKRLSNKSLFGVYATLALTLAAGSLLVAVVDIRVMTVAFKM